MLASICLRNWISFNRYFSFFNVRINRRMQSYSPTASSSFIPVKSIFITSSTTTKTTYIFTYIWIGEYNNKPVISKWYQCSWCNNLAHYEGVKMIWYIIMTMILLKFLFLFNGLCNKKMRLAFKYFRCKFNEANTVFIFANSRQEIHVLINQQWHERGNEIQILNFIIIIRQKFAILVQSHN